MLIGGVLRNTPRFFCWGYTRCEYFRGLLVDPAQGRMSDIASPNDNRNIRWLRLVIRRDIAGYYRMGMKRGTFPWVLEGCWEQFLALSAIDISLV